jgi:hypothetical protein
MVVHPRCPCSRASITELNVLMGRARDRLEAWVVFVKPNGVAEDFTATDLFRRASEIPGVSIHIDEGGVEAKRFRVATSGQALLYDRSGRLAFNGGITDSRGHEGDNDGLERLLALAMNDAQGSSSSAVYGCAVQDAK